MQNLRKIGPEMLYEKAWQDNDGYIENTMLPFLLDEDVIPSPQLGLKHSNGYKSKEDNSFVEEKIDYDTAWLIWKTWMEVNASSAPTAEYIQEFSSLHFNVPERLCIRSALRYIWYATDVCYQDACRSTIEKVEERMEMKLLSKVFDEKWTENYLAHIYHGHWTDKLEGNPVTISKEKILQSPKRPSGEATDTRCVARIASKSTTQSRKATMQCTVTGRGG